jgi:hypothetical protein
VLALLVIAFVPSAASAQWYRTYTDARERVQRGEWSEAERLLGQAARQAADAGVRQGRNVQTSAMRFIQFFPDYYLGVVYQATDRLDEARAAFERAKADGATSREREFRDIDERSNKVTLALAEASRRAAATRQVNAPPAYTAGSSTSAPGAVENRPETQTARETLTPSGNVYVQAPVQPQPGPAESKAGPLEEPPPDGERPSPAPVDTSTRVPDVRGRPLADARRILTQASLVVRATARTSSAAPDQVIEQSLPPGTRVPPGTAVTVAYATPPMTAGPDPEQIAVRAFFTGDYAEAIRTIEALVAKPPARQPIPPRVHFYLACSYAAQSILSPGDSGTLLQRARQALNRARPDQNAFALDRRYVSPRVLRVLEPPATVY